MIQRFIQGVDRVYEAQGNSPHPTGWRAGFLAVATTDGTQECGTAKEGAPGTEVPFLPRAALLLRPVGWLLL